MKKTNNQYESRTMNRNLRNEQKAAHRPGRLDRVLDSGASYMANYAIVRGNLSSFNSGFFKV